MAAPTKTTTNVMVHLANLYIGAVGTALPADTVAYNTDWGASVPAWYHPGYTESGVGFTVDRKEKKHRVEEESIPIIITIEETTMKVMLTFAEATLKNLGYAVGGGTVTTTAAGASQIGKRELVLSEDLETVALGFEGQSPEGFFRRILIPKVISVGKINAEHTRSKTKQLYKCEFESITPISQITIKEKFANATS